MNKSQPNTPVIMVMVMMLEYNVFPALQRPVGQKLRWFPAICSTIHCSKLGPYPAPAGPLEFLSYGAARAADPCNMELLLTRKCKDLI